MRYFHLAFLILAAGPADAAEPTFTIENKVPPKFTVTNKVPVVVPAREVRAQPPFTQGGTLTPVRRAGAISSASPGIYRMDSTPIPALTTAPYGAIRCVSYG